MKINSNKVFSTLLLLISASPVFAYQYGNTNTQDLNLNAQDVRLQSLAAVGIRFVSADGA